MRNYAKSKDVNAQIKTGLQVCYKVLNKDKYFEREHRLFSSLAELYLQNEKIRECPKVAAIYQYLKKLLKKHLKDDQEKQGLIDQRIKDIELRFLRKAKVPRSDLKNREQEVIGIDGYKEELEKFREGIKKELAAIEDLGIEKNSEELNEEGLQKRAQEVERIYMGIREFFIGKRDGKGELTHPGLANRLIEDCIKQLRGLPRVGKDNRECTYAVFGIGSMALGTMTPWSDLEFGILIEEGLTQADEERVKEYFRNLTSLLHIKVINFGETPLRMMGIEELNNFKLTDKSDSEHNWFFDNLTKSGLSFDGPHWHACKTPLGREEGYRKVVTKEGREELVPCGSFEFIGTIEQFMRFYQAMDWRRGDPELVQSLGHITFITGYQQLVLSYRGKLKTYGALIESVAFEILKKDSESLNPLKQVLDTEKEGQILNVKKEIYRFPDRMVVALGDCLKGRGNSSWGLIRSVGIREEIVKDLQIALGIASEIRLRTYANNNGQIEDMSAIARYESQLEGLKKEDLVEQVFYLRDSRILYKYYYVVVGLGLRIGKFENQRLLEEINRISITKQQNAVIRGYVYKKFLRYYEAIGEFESIAYKGNDYIVNTLARLYHIVGRNEEALKLYTQLSIKGNYSKDIVGSSNNLGITLHSLGRYEEALKYYHHSLITIRTTNRDHSEITNTLNNIGVTLQSLGEYEGALRYHKYSLMMRVKIHKGDHIEIAASLHNIGMLLESLGIYEEALQYKRGSLNMRCRIYKGNHKDIALSLNNIGASLKNLGAYEEALKYFQEGLEMMRKVYKEGHKDIAISLNNIGAVKRNLARLEEGLECYQASLKILRRIYDKDHSEVADLLSNMGMILKDLGKFDEALRYQQDGLDMLFRIYRKDHRDIASSLGNIGDILKSQGRYREALKYYLDSMNMYNKIYKGEHKDVASSLSSLGGCFRSLGRYKEALEYQQNSLGIYRKIYKGDHPSIAWELNAIGSTLKSLRRYEEALKYYLDSLDINRGVYKDDHPNIAMSLSNIGIILKILGKYEDALKYHKEGLEIFSKVYKDGHQDVAASLNNIGSTLNSMGRHETALEYHQECLKMRSRLMQDNHPDMIASINNVSLTLHNLAMIDEALKYQEKLSYLLSDDRNVQHNLACMYHIKALKDKEQGFVEGFRQYIYKVKTTFERTISEELKGVVEAASYVEYAQFMYKYHDEKNLSEYHRIIALLEIGIKTNDDTDLSYNQQEKLTTCESLQELLSKQKEITIKSKILGYYLLIKVYTIHNNMGLACKVLEEFKKQLEALKTAQDCFVGYHLLESAHKGIIVGKVKEVSSISSQVSVLSRSACILIAEYDGSLSYDQALSINSDGAAYFKSKSYNTAIVTFSKAVGLSFTTPISEVLYNRGRAYQESNSIVEAIEDYQELLRVNPSHVKAYYQLGVCFKQKGNLLQAESYLKQALAKDPRFEIAQKALDEINKVISGNIASKMEQQRAAQQQIYQRQ